jgi:hypothetical protein
MYLGIVEVIDQGQCASEVGLGQKCQILAKLKSVSLWDIR